jgi:hypothetical protein
VTLRKRINARRPVYWRKISRKTLSSPRRLDQAQLRLAGALTFSWLQR